MRKICSFIICFATILNMVHAQGKYTDTSSAPVLANAGPLYNRFIAKESRLYNGIEHVGYSFKIKGTAYFQEDKLQKGAIVYDQLTFTDVPMLYDQFKDQVIVRHSNNVTLIGLVNEKVSSFSLYDHHFIRLEFDSTISGLPRTGFYDEMYKGNTSVLVKRKRVIEETVKEEVERRFVIKDLYYIRKGGTCYNIKNYKELLTVLQDKNKEIKQYLRKNKLRFRKDRETTIVKATAYYDSLTR